jgi:hypothetical protein
MIGVVLPDTQTLVTGLASALAERDASTALTILRREPVPSPGRTLSEVVTCRLTDGRVRRLLCKYGRLEDTVGYGHWGGVPYEAAVYQQVLHALDVCSVGFRGTYHETEADTTWLFLDYLDDSARLDDTGGAAAFALAAAWIGRLHASARRGLSTRDLKTLQIYDDAYYAGWITRTALFAEPLKARFPWLELLCQRRERVVAPLLEASATVIHGEYYPKNILVQQTQVHPIDWESAAIGPGEIDLASLTERWPTDIVQQCEREYQLVRWPEGTPAKFERTLAAARLYLQFRWLGDRVKWTSRPKNHWRFDEMRRLAEQLEVI